MLTIMTIIAKYKPNFAEGKAILIILLGLFFSLVSLLLDIKLRI